MQGRRRNQLTVEQRKKKNESDRRYRAAQRADYNRLKLKEATAVTRNKLPDAVLSSYVMTMDWQMQSGMNEEQFSAKEIGDILNKTPSPHMDGSRNFAQLGQIYNNFPPPTQQQLQLEPIQIAPNNYSAAPMAEGYDYALHSSFIAPSNMQVSYNYSAVPMVQGYDYALHSSSIAPYNNMQVSHNYSAVPGYGDALHSSFIAPYNNMQVSGIAGANPGPIHIQPNCRSLADQMPLCSQPFHSSKFPPPTQQQQLRNLEPREAVGEAPIPIAPSRNYSAAMKGKSVMVVEGYDNVLHSSSSFIAPYNMQVNGIAGTSHSQLNCGSLADQILSMPSVVDDESDISAADFGYDLGALDMNDFA